MTLLQGPKYPVLLTLKYILHEISTFDFSIMIFSRVLCLVSCIIVQPKTFLQWTFQPSGWKIIHETWGWRSRIVFLLSGSCTLTPVNGKSKSPNASTTPVIPSSSNQIDPTVGIQVSEDLKSRLNQFGSLSITRLRCSTCPLVFGCWDHFKWK